jgi:hypothetical protein
MSRRGVLMGVWKEILERTAWCGVMLCAVSGAVSVAAAQQTAAPEQSASVSQQAELPDSPGATLAKLQPPAQQQSASGQSPSPPALPEPQGQQTQSQAQPPQKPVGTAAAEPTHAAGVAASQPAGVAVAPAKQRRSRTIVIRTAAMIGAGIAVGSVVALTAATSSKPPGAH